ncbi:MAG: DUF5675 family protein [Eubacteriaceae bacterium]
MKSAILKRTYKEDRTIGEFTLFDGNYELARFYTLERAWLDNKKNESCIPEGTYKVIPNNTKAHPDSFRLPDVPGRSGILIHSGNYYYHSLGCILLGSNLVDLDKDGKPDISNSKKAMDKLYKLVGLNDFELTIIEKI